jgi:acetaldehyde dehydrogenase (acetylating)
MTNGEIAKFQELLTRMVDNTKTVAGNMSAMATAINNLNAEVKALRDEYKRNVERNQFAEIIVRLKQRGVITDADAARWAEAEVAHGG